MIPFLRAAGLVLLIFFAWLPVRSDAADHLQRFRVEVNDHVFALWARIPPSPRGAVLLLHGRTWSSLPDFDLQVPGLNRSVLGSLAARGLAAYALDQRGYGATPRDATGWITPALAFRDAIAVVDWIASRHQHLPKPALLGWSLGAATAHLAAVREPKHLSALILYGYAPDPDAIILPVEEPALPPAVKNTPEAAAGDFISPKVTEKEVVEAFVRTALAADPVHVDWKDEDQFLCDSSKIGLPTLVLYGERDPNVADPSARRFLDRLAAKRKQRIVFRGADHCAHLESTHDAWISAVVGFLERSGMLAPAPPNIKDRKK